MFVDGVNNNQDQTEILWHLTPLTYQEFHGGQTQQLIEFGEFGIACDHILEKILRLQDTV